MRTPLSEVTSQGDLGGQAVAMRVDENSLAHLMSVLTKLYSDDELAVIREYPTNALDSHVEAGQTRPIEVWTPSALSPFFKVKDYGLGMSVDDITQVYSAYGASTKRSSDTQVGMLGLGAKSALALVPQFNVIAIKDGVKTYVSVSRTTSGGGEMRIIDTVSTTESNGVEISIPVPRSTTFYQKCVNFFRFWEPGTVLLDGKEPNPISGLKVGDFIVQSDLREDYIVMGNVAYPVSDGLYGYSWHKKGIVARVDIGEVNFTPSREELHYTAKTNDTIARLRIDFRNSLFASAQKDVSGAASHSEAFQIAEKWRSSFAISGLTFRRVAIPDSVSATHAFKNSERHRTPRWSRVIAPSDIDNSLYIVGFPTGMTMSASQRERISIYCEQNNLGIRKVYFSDKLDAFPSDPWVADCHVVNWLEIKKIKLERAKAAPRLKTEPYELYDGESRSFVSTLDTSRDILFLSTTDRISLQFARDCFPDAQVVLLSKGRWDKFRRNFPTALHVSDKIKKEKEALAAKVTYEDRVAHNNSWDSRVLSGVDPNLVNDPAVADFLRALKATVSEDAKQFLRLGGNIPTVPSPLHRYPGYETMFRKSSAHGTWYLNSYYRDFLKEN